jgi:mono/diheme cytochrome c family protein
MTKPYSTLLLLGLLVGLHGGCFSASKDKPSNPGAGAQTSEELSGLPCDVSKLLAEKCMECHGARPQQGAPSLGSYGLLTAKDKSGKTYAEIATERFRDEKAPMPPDDPLSDAEIAKFQKWVDSGEPTGTCDGVDDVFNVPEQCSSNVQWTRKDRGSQLMHPGDECIDCHNKHDDAPFFTIAGTLYPTAHEPDDCNGVNGTSAGAKVVITDKNGKVQTLSVNAAGNFYSTRSVALPYRAKVVVGDQEREMDDEQKSGDCNGCHTQQGDNNQGGDNKAPGRIILP